MPLLAKILLASAFSGLLGLAGGVLLLVRPKWTRGLSVHFTSFAVGVLLGVVFLDLLPEALEMDKAEPTSILLAALVAIIGFFFLERTLLTFHPHHHEDTSEHHHPVPSLLVIGDTLHNFIDGILIAISFLIQPALGILSTFAVLAHEIPQEMSDFSIMVNHGWARRRVLWANIFSALASLVGAALGFYFRETLEPILPQLLGFTAGVFLYISAADLMADISVEKFRDKTSHVFALVILGVASIWILGHLLAGG
ncbi:MAG: hypothetical protein A2722_04075 [Candidatus Doudnabacteria bacterium RIFCSPHIGHO2_01_FULL_50_11]|uniref:ZIP zinc transporter n=1 Tax=Candidatus Doudnabacteria bacterium RIFCSPHIGHO2_01_FULL_50_11 TaxID=1817828 RepID=A0A1F5PG11_9BACT|nr:MAG: hypothetical protein A2722_04075 [Candidatus Doudnabacteria bacterium RIFCSPHIGHO2_01_FULL_50_11]HLC44563.1 ZIP family metal transporter [Patescibacteria group bacterium]